MEGLTIVYCIFFIVCPVGYFGPSCNKLCHCLNSSDCNKQTGDCPGSCANGWVGPGCQTG